MAAWARRLIRAGWVRQVDSDAGYYRHHIITEEGRRGLRVDRHPEPRDG